MPFRTTVAAPGKVLVVGGYLVLDKKYNGLVIAVNSCVYTSVKTKKLDSLTNSFKVLVNSPQFTNGKWEYSVSLNAENNPPQSNTVLVEQDYTVSKNKNVFIETVLETFFGLLNYRNREEFESLKGTDLELLVVSDNDFYSQRHEFVDTIISSKKLSELPKFNFTKSSIEDVKKTGLGSSAALVTSLSSALMIHFGFVSKQSFLKNSGNNDDKYFVHGFSQYCHCLAQGKIGSGFDVSSAIFGSHIYQRFSPSSIEIAMQNKDPKSIMDAIDPKTKRIDSTAKNISIPNGFKLVLADVNAGSNTPSMVSKVLQWRKNNPKDSNELWEEISRNNTKIFSLFDTLVDESSKNQKLYDLAINKCSKTIASEWETTFQTETDCLLIIKLFSQIYETNNKVRKLMKLMGDKAGVEVEPDQQTKLLDQCLSSPGVIMAGVPGAGGYDAIYCMCLSEESAQLLESTVWKVPEFKVTPLLSRQSDSGCFVTEL
ncbi:hypothetical protein BB558_002005 [Smittium angustum]|uniref:Phosphomevalonate kinase n=1 Tax=Smittium angustum TaxID=133377 RepID=A0A2U1J9W9_SMIAN|nr:hypothetical protein BB558_002005 [Smittium angustum]